MRKAILSLYLNNSSVLDLKKEEYDWNLYNTNIYKIFINVIKMKSEEIFKKYDLNFVTKNENPKIDQICLNSYSNTQIIHFDSISSPATLIFSLTDNKFYLKEYWIDGSQFLYDDWIKHPDVIKHLRLKKLKNMKQ